MCACLVGDSSLLLSARHDVEVCYNRRQCSGYMSKGFFGHSSPFQRDPAPSPATAAAPRPRPHKEFDQVSVLCELGLLSDSDKRPRRRATTGGREQPGGARVAGLSTPSHPSHGPRASPNPYPYSNPHPQGRLETQKSTQRPIPILTSPPPLCDRSPSR